MSIMCPLEKGRGKRKALTTGPKNAHDDEFDSADHMNFHFELAVYDSYRECHNVPLHEHLLF